MIQSASDYIHYIRRPVQNPIHLKYSVTSQERKQLISEVGSQGLLIFEYLLRLASINKLTIQDTKIAEYFGWKESTAKRHRLRLQKEGWVATQKARLPGGQQTIYYYLGKDEVAQMSTG